MIRGWRRAAAILGGLAVVSLAGWFGTDALERYNDFCNACHLTPEVPLHAQIRVGFDSDPAVNLAGVHARSTEPARAHRAVSRCIDCHV